MKSFLSDPFGVFADVGLQSYDPSRHKRPWLLRVLFIRSKRQTVWIVIGLAVLFPLGLGISIGLSSLRQYLHDHYTRAADDAIEHGQPAEALACCQWLVWLEPENLASQFKLAENYRRIGDADQADALLAELAPANRVGYPPAHVAIIRRDLAADDVTPARLRAIGSELTLLTGHHDSQELDALRVRLWLLTGQVAEAEALLDARPELPAEVHLLAARTLGSLHRRQAARRQATRAAQQFESRVDKQEDLEARVQWAEAAAISGDAEAAQRILQAGLVLHPGGPFALELARLYLQVASRASAAGDAATREQFITSGIKLLEPIEVKTSEVSYALYQLHLLRGNQERAFECLSQVVRVDRAKLLDLAKFHAQRGGQENCRQVAHSVQAECLEVLQRRPYGRTVRLLAAEAALLLRDYSQAVELLNAAYQQIPEPRFAVPLADAYLAWWDAEMADANASVTKNLQLLEAASATVPGGVELTKRYTVARLRLSALEHDAVARLDRLEQQAGATE